MAPKYTLNYFDLAARGEPIRLMFHAAGVEFNDNRISFADWGSFKADAAKCPLGQLPVLEVDGKLICQSNAIYRYVAREFGFYGDTSCEKGRIDQISETVVEIVNGVIPIMFGGHDEEAKKKKFEEFFGSEQLKRQMTFINNFLKSNDGGNAFFVGKKLSLADILFFVHGTTMVSLSPKVLDGFPEMAGLLKRVGEVENLKKYLDAQKKEINK